MLNLTLKYQIAKVGLYLESQHIKYWKMFHLQNLKNLNKRTYGPIVTGLQKNQIETRILKILHESQLVDMKDFAWNLDIKHDLYLDSLGLTVLLTSIQQEFNTIFDDDDEFQNVRTLAQVVQILMKDESIV